MRMIGYFEGIDSKRALSGAVLTGCCRRSFFGAGKLGNISDHSWLSKKRSRLPHEVDEKVFELKIGMATMTRVPPFMRTTTG